MRATFVGKMTINPRKINGFNLGRPCIKIMENITDTTRRRARFRNYLYGQPQEVTSQIKQERGKEPDCDGVSLVDMNDRSWVLKVVAPERCSYKHAKPTFEAWIFFGLKENYWICARHHTSSTHPIDRVHTRETLLQLRKSKCLRYYEQSLFHNPGPAAHHTCESWEHNAEVNE